MDVTSKTGLVPTPKRNSVLVRPKRRNSGDLLPTEYIAKPVKFSLRPFGGLFNPYAKGCSVLCNHPAPSAVRNIINQLKTSLTTEGKIVQIHKEKQPECDHRTLETDNIPEDLFRRYTDTDSRPLTPSPTVTSVRTRTSAGSFLNARRCITPELGKNEIIKRKKIILDLRRSHSQETLYWKPSSEVSQRIIADCKAQLHDVNTDGSHGTKPKRQKSDETKSKTAALASQNISEGSAHDPKKQLPPAPQSCINEQVLEDEDVRRGKRRKKIKTQPITTTFHLSNDPETQVATLGPDSLNPSTRPSLIPNGTNLLLHKDKRESEPILLKGSFLSEEAFQALKTDLDVDVIENTFEKYLNIARREAIKYIPRKPKQMLKSTTGIDEISLETHQQVPRKFSKSATRFEVPMNLKELERMTVLDYLRKYVWVSRQRKQLYKKTFLKYLIQVDSETDATDGPNQSSVNVPTALHGEYVERTMSTEHFDQALQEVLEFHGNERNIAEVLRLLQFSTLKFKELNFRSWCGIVSFAERLALDDPSNTDSCDELEKSDFSAMEEQIYMFNISDNLREVFEIIRRTHCIKNL